MDWIDVRPVLLFFAGAAVGVIIVSYLIVPSPAEIPSSEEVSSEGSVVRYETDGLFNRTISFYSGERGVSCDVSRKDEIEIAEATFLYNNSTSCTARLPVDRKENEMLSLALSKDSEVLFKTYGHGGHGIGFNFPGPEEYAVCNVSESQRQSLSGGDLQYSVASCGVSEGDLYDRWDNSSFSDLHVYEAGQESSTG